MHSTLTNSVCKSFLIVLVLGLALVGEVSAPTGGPLKRGFGSNGDFSLASRFSNGKFSASKSATSLSSLPPDAQRPIAAALGRDDPTYWLHQNPQGFRGENLQHALVTEFTRQGAELRSEARSEVRSQSLSWGLQTHAYGYGDALHSLKAVAPHAKANRVEYRRDGMTEWYENGPLGLEQGFTLSHPPGKTLNKAPQGSNGEPLTLELVLAGDLVATLEPGGKGLELRRRDGEPALRYTGLQARDATGRELPSWLEVQGEKLLVRVKDKGAQYPVVIDPWIQTAYLTASDGDANDLFGSSVAINGSTLIVGAPYHSVGSNGEQGAAYVFVKSGGTWIQQAELTASDGAELDKFGTSVAVSGSTAVVGAWAHAVGSNYEQGAAYVFVESGGTWIQQAELIASDGAIGDEFGWSVAVSGSTAVVGAFDKAVGAAYVFVDSGGTWTQQAELEASDEGGDRFGWSVALYGTTALVGAPTHQVGSNSQQGAAYVFAQSGVTWNQQAELTASDGAANDQFGSSVGISVGTIVVGANFHAVGSNQFQGAAYAFTNSGATWIQQAELTASDGAWGDQFGSSVAVNGSTIAVGAPHHPSSPPPPYNSGPGAAYMFAKSDATWRQQGELLAADGGQFGVSVAVSGSTTVVGANDELFLRGAVHVFSSSGPLYTLSAAPRSLSVLPGGQATATITVTPFNGFSGSVSLYSSGGLNGVTAAFTPNPATSTSTLTLTASATATEGTALLIVNGSSGTLTQTTPLMLTVLPAPEVKIVPTALSFGYVVINTTSPARLVTIKNIGQATLNFTSGPVITPGTNFKISGNTCPTAVFPGQSCQVSVEFKPTALGKLAASLSFTDNASNSPQSMTLSGVGVEPATLIPASATYATQKVGTTSAAKTFTLTNYQSVALTSIAISTMGDFALSTTTCGTSLAAKTKCTIGITFTPSQTGTRTGQLIVKDSASNSPQLSELKGTGN